MRLRLPLIASVVLALITTTGGTAALAQRHHPADHLVRLANRHLAGQIERAFGKRALWAWDAHRHRFRSVVNFAPGRGAALYTPAGRLHELRVRLADSQRAARARRRAAALHRAERSRETTRQHSTVHPKPSAGRQPQPTSTPAPSQGVPASPPPLSGTSGPWRLIFDDEFSGDTLDTTKWTPFWFADGATSNGTAMDAANVSVAGGTLRLDLTPTSGGLVSSNGKFSFTFGYVEARIDLPGSAGSLSNWPAFWTDGQNWPQDGEIDVMEGLGGAACWHFHSSTGSPGG